MPVSRRWSYGIAITTTVSALLMFLMPLAWKLVPSIAYLVGACAYLGAILGARPPQHGRSWPDSATRPALWMWIGCSLTTLTALRFQFPEIAPNPLTTIMNLGTHVSLRSLLDVLVVAGVLRLAFALTANARNGDGVGRIASASIACMIVGASAACLQPQSLRDFIVVFDAKHDLGVRAFRLFDLGTLVWCAGVVPLAMARDAFGAEVSNLTKIRVSDRRRFQVVVGGVLASLTVATILVSLRGPVIDTLPAIWWLRKALSIGLSVALVEEIVWRLYSLAMILAICQVQVGPQRSEWVTAIVAGCLFALFHLTQGMGAMALALVFGICANILVLRFGLFWAAVALHLIVDLVIVPWN